MLADFIHLKVHSAYSLAEGAVKVPELIELCLKNKMPAMGLTDSGNLFGALEFSLYCAQKGIQPIVGCKVKIKTPSSQPNAHLNYSSLVLLAQSEEGYQNLLQLVSESYLLSDDVDAPCVTLAAVKNFSHGLILLTGGMEGPLNQLLVKHNTDGARHLLQELKEAFGDRLYVEITRLGLPDEQRIEEGLLDLAFDLELPLVATNEVYFSGPDMHEAHDILLCISEGVYVSSQERRRVTPEHYFKTAAQMKELFEDLPEAIANTLVIAQRCYYMPKAEKPILPPYPTDSGRSEVEELRYKSATGLEARLTSQVFAAHQSAEEREKIRELYQERLEYELAVIEKMGFPGYFLIVSDFIQWAKSQNIPVGPGRGSGAGSLVAWVLTITDIDPIRFNLLFERFLNPERVSMPDFDVDFCQDRRDEVINYVREKYGDDRVAHIITFGKLQARAVLRDVGRVLEMPYGQVDRICKLIPNNPANPVTLAQALDIEPQLKEQMRAEQTVEKLITIGLKLEGLYRHASTHAAGVVIGDRPLHKLVPLYRDPRSPLPATQFNMKFVEQAGLMKFDFLGLKTLTVISKTCDLLGRKSERLDISTISLADDKTFALLNRVETFGVFQLESGGMRDVLRRLRPDRFEELIALVALYRPGPMDDIPRYLACKHGEEPVHYLHPMLEPILNESFGVMVVQEQVMQIAQVMGGYSLGGADLLRRAMGKKNRDEMNAQRKKFVEGALERGVPSQIADAVFEQMAKFAGYGFNKSHAAPYALLTYQTAYLKANYPVEFLSASMTLDMHNVDKINQYRQELRRYNIPLLPPDINASFADFESEPVKEGEGIRYALAAIKNVGYQAMQIVVEERQKNGPYKDIIDFAKRLDSKIINKRQLENLILAGAFDRLHPNRRSLWNSMDFILQQSREVPSNALRLFSDEPLDIGKSLDPTPEWGMLERLQREFEALGFYLSSHPLEGYPLEDFGVTPSSQLHEVLSRGDTGLKVAGILISSKERASKTGQRYAFLQMSDAMGQYEVVIFSELLARSRDQLQAGRAFLMSVSGKLEGDNMRLTVQALEPLESKISDRPLELTIADQSTLARVAEVLKQQPPGHVKITLHVPINGTFVTVGLPHSYQLSFEARTTLQAFQLKQSA